MVPASSGRRRHMFANKAEVMEAGKPLVIRPKNAERLVFEIDGETGINMKPGDVLTLQKNCEYSLKGSAKYLVINTPAFKDGDDTYLM